jgi:hypothetical protein
MATFLVSAAEAAAETVLGPWGVVAGLGVGAIVLARKARRSAAGGSGGDEDRFPTGWTHRVPGVAAVGTAAAHVGEWWSDLYAEARHDWEVSRASGPSEAEEPAPAVRRARRPRGANGRFEPAAGD